MTPYLEENDARVLRDRLAQALPSCDVKVSGEGCHWTIFATCGMRAFSIYCCRVKSGPQFCVTFREGLTDFPTGRTTDPEAVAASTRDWFSGISFPHLYSRYPFIDLKKRSLQAVMDALSANSRQLATLINPELQSIGADLYHLRYRADDRECRIFFYGENEVPDFDFSWNECGIFHVESKRFDLMADVIEQWVCAKKMPSEMARQFSWLVSFHGSSVFMDRDV